MTRRVSDLCVKSGNVLEACAGPVRQEVCAHSRLECGRFSRRRTPTHVLHVVRGLPDLRNGTHGPVRRARVEALECGAQPGAHLAELLGDGTHDRLRRGRGYGGGRGGGCERVLLGLLW